MFEKLKKNFFLAWPGVKPGNLGKARSHLNHWTHRDVLLPFPFGRSSGVGSVLFHLRCLGQTGGLILDPGQLGSCWWGGADSVGGTPDLDSADPCLSFSNCCASLGKLLNFSLSPFPHLETRGLHQVVSKVRIKLDSRDFSLHQFGVIKSLSCKCIVESGKWDADCAWENPCCFALVSILGH